MSGTSKLLFLSCCFAMLGARWAVADFSELVKTYVADGILVQTQSDPNQPEQGWVLTELTLNFHGVPNKSSVWEVQFDRGVFKELTTTEAGDGYRLRRLQASRNRSGTLYLLAENSGHRDEKRTRYIFGSFDGGDSWRLTKATGPASEGLKISGRAVRARPNRQAHNSESRASKKRSVASDAAEEAVDLAQLDAEPAAGGSSGLYSKQPAAASSPMKAYFDFWLTLRKGVTPLTFDNYHTLLFLELSPVPNIQFGAEISSSPRFYELAYQVTPRFELRAGKIWILFDQLGFYSPHNLFGGFFNVSRFRQPGASSFLPDLWTDLGVAMKYQLLESKDLVLDVQFFVVNGFQDGGKDPMNEIGTKYPSFDSPPLQDNNTDKAMGGRIHAMVNNAYSIAASVYSSRYTPEADDGKRMLIAGLDAQIRLMTRTQLRGGYIYMQTDLPSPASSSSFKRGGYYLELSQNLSDRWKIIARGGAAQNDNRVTDVSDIQNVGASLLYSIGYLQLSLMHFEDLNQVAGKATYQFTAMRAVVLF